MEHDNTELKVPMMTLGTTLQAFATELGEQLPGEGQKEFVVAVATLAEIASISKSLRDSIEPDSTALAQFPSISYTEGVVRVAGDYGERVKAALLPEIFVLERLAVQRGAEDEQILNQKPPSFPFNLLHDLPIFKALREELTEELRAVPRPESVASDYLRRFQLMLASSDGVSLDQLNGIIFVLSILPLEIPVLQKVASIITNAIEQRYGIKSVTIIPEKHQ